MGLSDIRAECRSHRSRIAKVSGTLYRLPRLGAGQTTVLAGRQLASPHVTGAPLLIGKCCTRKTFSVFDGFRPNMMYPLAMSVGDRSQTFKKIGHFLMTFSC